MSSNEKYFLGTLTKTLTLLELFRDHEKLGLTEMGQSLSLSKSNVYRIVITLEHHGYLEKTKDQKYKLGTKLFFLGRLVLDRQEIIPIARPFIKELTRKVKESAYLAILTHDLAVTFLVREKSDYSITAGTRIGRRLPAYSTADGKVLLAFSPPEITSIFFQSVEIKKRTDFTVSSKNELAKKLEEIRQQGFAIDSEETEIGMISIAAPVYDISGKILASISVTGPAYRIESLTEEITKEVVYTAKEISKALLAEGRK